MIVGEGGASGCCMDGGGCTFTFVEASPGGLRSEARLAAAGGAEVGVSI